MKPTMIKTIVTVAFGSMIALTLSMSTSYAAAPDSVAACDVVNPIVMVTTSNSQKNVPTNQTMKITLVGPVTNANKMKHGSNNRQRVKVCEGALVDYRAESTVGTASCTLDKRPIPPHGKIKVDEGMQRLICTDKPDGLDVDQLLIVGVNR
jgi:hypothetical protein